MTQTARSVRQKSTCPCRQGVAQGAGARPRAQLGRGTLQVRLRQLRELEEEAEDQRRHAAALAAQEEAEDDEIEQPLVRRPPALRALRPAAPLSEVLAVGWVAAQSEEEQLDAAMHQEMALLAEAQAAQVGLSSPAGAASVLDTAVGPRHPDVASFLLHAPPRTAC